MSNGVSRVAWARQHAQAVHRKLSDGGMGVKKRKTGWLDYVDPDHPLLKKLEGEMRGTYRHSIIVGSLAAVGAAHIDGDADLARVLGYYHDAGKLHRRELYGECRMGARAGYQPIGKINALKTILAHPQMSRVYAERYNLPAEVRDLVSQHHGKVITGVRLTPALAARLTEEDLYYPGPLPSTRESALVMYADCVQAYVDGLAQKSSWPLDQTLDYLRGRVDKIGEELRSAGQLANSTLTEKELDAAAEGFANWLYRYHHNLKVTGTPQGEGPLNDGRLDFPPSRR